MITVIIILAVLLLALLWRRRRPADTAPTVFEGYRTDNDLIVPGTSAGSTWATNDPAPDTSFQAGGGDFGGGGASGDWGDGGSSDGSGD